LVVYITDCPSNGQVAAKIFHQAGIATTRKHTQGLRLLRCRKAGTACDLGRNEIAEQQKRKKEKAKLSIHKIDDLGGEAEEKCGRGGKRDKMK
jgi:hypothetical protein